MFQKTIALVLVLIMVLVIVGCSGTQPDVQRVGEPDAVAETTEDVDEVNSLSEDLDTSDLDDLDQDLDDITW